MGGASSGHSRDGAVAREVVYGIGIHAGWLMMRRALESQPGFLARKAHRKILRTCSMSSVAGCGEDAGGGGRRKQPNGNDAERCRWIGRVSRPHWQRRPLDADSARWIPNAAVARFGDSGIRPSAEQSWARSAVAPGAGAR